MHLCYGKPVVRIVQPVMNRQAEHTFRVVKHLESIFVASIRKGTTDAVSWLSQQMQKGQAIKQEDKKMVRARFSTLFWFILAVFAMQLILMAGCGQQSGTYLGGKRTSQIGKVSKEDLAQELEDFEDRTAHLLRETSQTLRELDPESATFSPACRTRSRIHSPL